MKMNEKQCLLSVLIIMTLGLLQAQAAPKHDISMTLVPPSPVTDKVVVDIRGAVWNLTAEAKQYDVSIYLNKEEKAALLHEETLNIEANAAAGIKFRWPTEGNAGTHTLIFTAKDGRKTCRTKSKIEIISSDIRSTKRIDGGWFEFYHWSEAEGRLWNKEIIKMSDDQWREMIRAMHGIGMDLVIIQELFRNQQYVGKHNMEKTGYTGKAYYPSKLYPQRKDIAAKDCLEAVLSEADKHGMQVMVGVGCYAWFDFSAGSLEWHKRVADELWEMYGHHPSFYGWYVSEEIAGNLGTNTQRREAIVAFFKAFKEHVRRLAPDKPVMLATNCHVVKQSDGYYPKLLEHLDILCPFGFHRMPREDYSGAEVAQVLQKYCDDAKSHLWMDMEVFLFGKGSSLYPRPIGQVIPELLQFTNFEKVCCYSFTGLMNAPWQSIKPGGPATVKLYEDYLKYYKEGPPKPLIHAGRNKPVTLGSPAHKSYPGEGTSGLVDGVLGHCGDLHSEWLGFHGDDLTATVDLGASTDISELAAHFMQETGAGIYLPAQVEFAASDDGKIFRNIATLKPKAAESTPHTLTVQTDKLDIKARYVRVTAKNIGTLPAGHSAAGQPAWLFCDEIMVNPEADKAARK